MHFPRWLVENMAAFIVGLLIGGLAVWFFL